MKDFPGINNIEIKLEGGGRASVMGRGTPSRGTPCASLGVEGARGASGSRGRPVRWKGN